MRIYTILLLLVAQVSNAQYIHSHNDYKQDEPFYEALAGNAYSIEVDVFLRNGELFVAHDEEEISEKATLENLYLQPLLTLDYFSRVQLLVDIKSDATETLDLLVEILNRYPALTSSDQIRFVISGNRPGGSDYGNYPDFIWFDHQSLDDLEELDFSKVALFSFPYYKFSAWNGGEFVNDKETLTLRKTIEYVHSMGFDIRFWASPDTPLAWRTMQQLKVDYINTDKPALCNQFLNMYK